MKPYYWLTATLLIAITSCGKVSEKPDEETTDNTFLVTPTGTLGTPADIASNADNVYITGSTYGPAGTTVNFGDVSLRLGGGSDAFIARYDRKGVAIWAKILGGLSDEWGYATAVDKSGNVYVAGSFNNTAVIDGITLTAKLIDTHLGRNQFDMFLVKYDKDGNQLWLKQVSGAGYERPVGIAIDNNGKILVTGYFDSSIAFETTGTTTTAGPAFFITSFNADGSLNWNKIQGEGKNGTIQPKSIKVTSKGNIIVYGAFSGTKKLGTTMYTSGDSDIFLMKLNAQGDITWERTFGWSTTEANGLAVDDDESTYLAGDYKSMLKIGNITLSGDNVRNGFLASYDKDGIVLWANKINDDAAQTTESALDLSCYNNKIYLSGFYGGKLTLGNTTLTTMGGVLQGFIVAYNPDGSVVQAQNLASRSVIPSKFQIDNSGNAALYGTFSGTFTLDNKDYTPLGNNTVFLAVYKAE
ncbi:MAG: hypothetical protein EOP46_18560 [Sphingobacteriaceae bacterium]|nr:MAG: hypothetical protein EOP46_18560 [Sphingobacteriaceae bacterium]